MTVNNELSPMVQGDLPDELFQMIEWPKLRTLCSLAVAGQPEAVRSEIELDSGLIGNTGWPVIDFELLPFEDGWLRVFFHRQPIASIHVSRLLPENPWQPTGAFGVV